MDKLTKTFFNNTYSLSQARRRLDVLKDYLNQTLYNLQPTQNIEISDQQWLKSFDKDFFKNFTKANADKIINSIQDLLKNPHLITLHLAVELPEEIINDIGLWVRKNTKLIIFDTKIDPNLIGGAAISLQGIYKDYSLKVSLEAQRDKVLATMKSYLRS